MALRQITEQTLLPLELAPLLLLSVIKVVTPERMELTCKVITRPLTMVPTTITIQLVGMLIVSLVQQALVLATIPLMHITTELAEPSIQAVAVGNTILIVMEIRLMYPKEDNH